MHNTKLRKLLQFGERDNVDYKLTCEAFCSKRIKEKAELAKDICAMANNGNIASYLIIGVSDDRTIFKSTSSLKLTPDNLQDFVKSAIFPPPKITVTTAVWEGSELTIIQIGPQPKRAFRIHRDFIEYQSQTCIRRNDVWIRRNATTDLATPEEIVGLLGQKTTKEKLSSSDNVRFDRVPRNQQTAKVMSILEQMVVELGGQLQKTGRSRYHIVVPVNGSRYVWQVNYYDYSPDIGNTFRRLLRWQWAYEHGSLILTESTSSKGLLQYVAHTHFKESWGWFSSLSDFGEVFHSSHGSKSSLALVPSSSEPLSHFVFHLAGVKDSDTLRRDFLELLDFLEVSDGYSEEVKVARDKLNAQLRLWLGTGWGTDVSRKFIRKKPEELKLSQNEFYDPSSGQVLKVRKPKHLVSFAKNILTLSGDKI